MEYGDFESFEILKCFIPRRDVCLQTPVGVQLVLLMFYPPKGLCKADTEGGPIVFTYVLFSLRKRILDFHFTGGNPPF